MGRAEVRVELSNDLRCAGRLIGARESRESEGVPFYGDLKQRDVRGVCPERFKKSHEILRDMIMGVVPHAVCKEGATVQAFLGVVVKASLDRGTDETGDNRGTSREEFKIESCVKMNSSELDNHFESGKCEREEVCIFDYMDVLRGKEFKHLDALYISSKNEEVALGVLVGI